MKNALSQRVATVPPSGIRKFFDIAATMKDVISLGIGEPDFVSPPADHPTQASAPLKKTRRITPPIAASFPCAAR